MGIVFRKTEPFANSVLGCIQVRSASLFDEHLQWATAIVSRWARSSVVRAEDS